MKSNQNEVPWFQLLTSKKKEPSILMPPFRVKHVPNHTRSKGRTEICQSGSSWFSFGGGSGQTPWPPPPTTQIRILLYRKVGVTESQGFAVKPKVTSPPEKWFPAKPDLVPTQRGSIQRRESANIISDLMMALPTTLFPIVHSTLRIWKHTV